MADSWGALGRAPFRDTESIPEIEGEDDPLRSQITSFEALGLSENLLKGVAAMKFVSPSKIQGLTIPILQRKLNPCNLIAQAQSGTGKTAAFSLSMLAKVDPEKHYPQAICLSPTRELCRQTFDVIRRLGKYTGVKTRLVIPQKETGVAGDTENIEEQILACTPSKLDSLVKRREIKLEQIVMFIIDEADELLEIQGSGCITQRVVKAVLKANPSCLLGLFSATFTPEVTEFANTIIPAEAPKVSILVPAEKLSVKKLYQYVIETDDKFRALDLIFHNFSVGQTVIFVNKRETAFDLDERLRKAGHEISVLVGYSELDSAGKVHKVGMTETSRDKIMDAFRRGEHRILISTNVLARGLPFPTDLLLGVDVLQVSLVVNYDLPVHFLTGGPDHEVYLHRVGRSARYDNSGVAINLVTGKREVSMVQSFQEHFGREIKQLKESNRDIQDLAELLENVV